MILNNWLSNTKDLDVHVVIFFYFIYSNFDVLDVFNHDWAPLAFFFPIFILLAKKKNLGRVSIVPPTESYKTIYDLKESCKRFALHQKSCRSKDLALSYVSF